MVQPSPDIAAMYLDMGLWLCRYVCLYDVEDKMLLRRVQISSNRSLDGVLDQLNSKDMTDAGPAQLLADAPVMRTSSCRPLLQVLRRAQSWHVKNNPKLLSVMMISLSRWLRDAVACHLHWAACSCSSAQPTMCSYCTPGHA